MKVAIAPGVWRDDGPQVAVAHISYMTVAASPIGSMTPPPSSGPVPVTAAEMAKRRRYAPLRKARAKA